MKDIRGVSFGVAAGRIRQRATSTPSAEVPLMTPATIMFFGFVIL
jgi:hypothetical protein